MDDPFSRMQDSARRAERYRKVAQEFAELAKDAYSPILRADFQRTAEEYLPRAQGELKVLECHRALRDGVSKPRSTLFDQPDDGAT
jgi:hypothetical protein